MYFTKEVEEDIILYNNMEDTAERSRLYNDKIKYALDKLSENIIRTFKFYYTDGESYDDVKHNVVTFLLEKLPNYTQGKGKAFSYFSIVAKNYLILHNTRNYKKLINKSESVEAELIADSLVDPNQRELVEPASFVDEFISYWDTNLEKSFTRKQDQHVVDSIVHLFRKRDKLAETDGLFNKKAIYVYIKGQTDTSTQQISRIVKLLKKKYNYMAQDYLRLGYIPKNKIY